MTKASPLKGPYEIYFFLLEISSTFRKWKVNGSIRHARGSKSSSKAPDQKKSAIFSKIHAMFFLFSLDFSYQKNSNHKKFLWKITEVKNH